MIVNVLVTSFCWISTGNAAFAQWAR